VVGGLAGAVRTAKERGKTKRAKKREEEGILKHRDHGDHREEKM